MNQNKNRLWIKIMSADTESRKCPACHHEPENPKARFCEQCGQELKIAGEAHLLYIGVPRGRGVFEITFGPVRAEFNNSEEAEKAAGSTVWNGSGAVPVKLVKRLRSSVPISSHPFICAKCGEQVATTSTGLCGHCDSTDWKERVS